MKRSLLMMLIACIVGDCYIVHNLRKVKTPAGSQKATVLQNATASYQEKNIRWTTQRFTQASKTRP